MDKSSSFLKTVDPGQCRLLLDTGDRKHLWEAFMWTFTPQGLSYWCDIYIGNSRPTESDIFLIESWIIEATFTTS